MRPEIETYVIHDCGGWYAWVLAAFRQGDADSGHVRVYGETRRTEPAARRDIPTLRRMVKAAMESRER